MSKISFVCAAAAVLTLQPLVSNAFAQSGVPTPPTLPDYSSSRSGTSSSSSSSSSNSGSSVVHEKGGCKDRSGQQIKC
jgi:hypothetical protein